jgi:ubiquitin C-terminal hydrolase
VAVKTEESVSSAFSNVQASLDNFNQQKPNSDPTNWIRNQSTGNKEFSFYREILELPEKNSKQPPQIIIQLTRFDNFGNKIEVPVKVSDINLEIFKYNTIANQVADPHSGQMIKVAMEPRAIVVHRGTDSANGHYVAYTKNKPGQWILHDDQTITVLKGKDLDHAMNGEIAQNAYMILYVPKKIVRFQ